MKCEDRLDGSKKLLGTEANKEVGNTKRKKSRKTHSDCAHLDDFEVASFGLLEVLEPSAKLERVSDGCRQRNERCRSRDKKPLPNGTIRLGDTVHL